MEIGGLGADGRQQTAETETSSKFTYLVAGADVDSILQEVEDFVDVPRSGSPQETGVTVRLRR